MPSELSINFATFSWIWRNCWGSHRSEESLQQQQKRDQNKQKKEEPKTMQGMEENVKETVIGILEEITEDAVPMKKKQDAIIQK